MRNLQGAIGIHQLARVETTWLRHGEILSRYTAHFADVPMGLPAVMEPEMRHAYHLPTIAVCCDRAGIKRYELPNAMNARGIGTGVHYLALPEHPYYQQRLGSIPEALPNAMRIGQQAAGLPISPKLARVDLDRVVGAVRGMLARPNGSSAASMAARSLGLPPPK